MKKLNNRLSNKNFSGQSLFEVVLALGVMSFVLLGIVSLSAASVRNSSFSNNNALATKYSRNGMEWVREERDTDWSSFVVLDNPLVSGSTAYCISDLSSWTLDTGSCSAISGTIFTRRADITTVNADTVEVAVRVTWTDAQGIHTARNSTVFTNWNR